MMSEAEKGEILSPEQVKAARALLSWTKEELAGNCGVSTTTIRHLESGRRHPSLPIFSAIRDAFESAGVEFSNGAPPELRLRRTKP